MASNAEVDFKDLTRVSEHGQAEAVGLLAQFSEGLSVESRQGRAPSGLVHSVSLPDPTSGHWTKYTDEHRLGTLNLLQHEEENELAITRPGSPPKELFPGVRGPSRCGLPFYIKYHTPPGRLGLSQPFVGATNAR